jgi:cellulose synthase (UDP-forming)
MLTHASLDKTRFLKTETNKLLLAFTVVMAVLYFLVITFLFPRGNPYLFWLLIAGGAFHLWQVLTYAHAIWDQRTPARFDSQYHPPVDVFITIAGEPVEVVEETIRAAKNMDYDAFRVFILNDGYVAKKDNWQDIERLAQDLGVECITRRIPGGAKSGNINNALEHTSSPFVAVLDCDHVPHRDFLTKMMGYFTDTKVGFVQSPQFYRNHELNYVTAGAWEQQKIFFGTICQGKNRVNAAFMCGTNMVIRREALIEVGGMSEESITEDFITSQYIHANGYSSVYVPEVLAEGLAPEDFLSYSKQQFRWARGSLEGVFKYNPLFRKGLSLGQRIQYLASSSFYLSGLVVAMYALFPLIFFYAGIAPFKAPTMALAAVFLPYIFLVVYTLRHTSNFSYTYRAVAFAMGAFTIHIKALFSILIGEKVGFAVTSKKQVEGNYLSIVAPHIIYIVLTVIGIGVAVARDGITASLMNNIAWSMFYIAVFIPAIIAAAPAHAFVPAQKPARIIASK